MAKSISCVEWVGVNHCQLGTYYKVIFPSPFPPFFALFLFAFSLSYHSCLPPIPLLPSLCSSVLFSSTLSSLIPQAYYFDDSDDQSVSDINPLIRRPPSQATTCHTHIITGYLSAVEAIVLVRWKLGWSIISITRCTYSQCMPQVCISMTFEPTCVHYF